MNDEPRTGPTHIGSTAVGRGDRALEARKRKGRGASWLRRLARLGLVVLVTWALYRALDLNLARLDLADFARWRPDAWTLALSAVAVTGVYFLHAMLWRRVAHDLGAGSIPARVALRIYFIANLGRYLPGKLWQVAGYAALARQAGLSGLTALAAAGFAQITFLLTGVLAFTLLLPARAGPIPILVGLALAALVLGAVRFMSATLTGRRLRDRLGDRLGEHVRAVLEAGGSITVRDMLIWVVGYSLSWALLGGAFVIFAAAFVPEAASRPAVVAGALAGAYVGGYIMVFAPAGVGVREGMLAVLLAEVVAAPAAAFLAVASRAWFTLTELVPLAVLPFLRERRTPQGEEEEDPDGRGGAP